jgi:hypothetical protein
MMMMILVVVVVVVVMMPVMMTGTKYYQTSRTVTMPAYHNRFRYHYTGIVQMYDEIIFCVPNTTQQLVLSFNESISNKTSHLYLLHYAADVWTPKLYTSIRGECC